MLDLKSKFGRKVKKHLTSEYVIWLTTVSADGTPQPRPVWFLWDEGTILIYSEPTAYKVRHVKANPRVSLHFNTDEKGEEAVIVLLGSAVLDPHAPPAHQMPAYLKKYRSGIEGLKSTPDRFGREYSTAIRVTPESMRGW
jgi:PPOX class probable F420-dependent enzyme